MDPLYLISIFLIAVAVGGAPTLTTLQVIERRRLKATWREHDERIARRDLIALCRQDPREWIAEGEARALAEETEWPAYEPEPVRITINLEHAAEVSARPKLPTPADLSRLAEALEEPTRPPVVYGATCMAGQLPDFTCLCLRCQQRERPSAGQLTASGVSLLDLITTAWVALYRGLERVWDVLLRVLR